MNSKLFRITAPKEDKQVQTDLSQLIQKVYRQIGMKNNWSTWNIDVTNQNWNKDTCVARVWKNVVETTKQISMQAAVWEPRLR